MGKEQSSLYPVEKTHKLTSAENRVLEKIHGIGHGKVTVHIQDGKVVQIDAEEKERLTTK